MTFRINYDNLTELTFENGIFTGTVDPTSRGTHKIPIIVEDPTGNKI